MSVAKYRFVLFDVDSTLVTIEGIDFLAGGNPEIARLTEAAMNGKPVIVSIILSKPAIVAEFEKQADAIIANFGVQDQALLDIISGAAEPSGLLPVQMPANMKTVEEQKEDTPHDMECYVDSDGHKYDFGYGMNWKGIINDVRTKKYKVAEVKKSF